MWTLQTLLEGVTVLIPGPRPFLIGTGSLRPSSFTTMGGTDHGGVNVTRVNITIGIQPINSPPNAEIQERFITVTENSPLCLNAWASNISPGGLGLGLEGQQRVRFRFRQIAGSEGVISHISAGCKSSGFDCHAFSQDDRNSLSCLSSAWSDGLGPKLQ